MLRSAMATRWPFGAHPRLPTTRSQISRPQSAAPNPPGQAYRQLSMESAMAEWIGMRHAASGGGGAMGAARMPGDAPLGGRSCLAPFPPPPSPLLRSLDDS